MSCVGNHCHKQAFATAWTSPDTPRSIPQTSLIKNEEGTSCNWAMVLPCSVFICDLPLPFLSAVVHCSSCFLMWGSIVLNHRKIIIPRFHAEMSVWHHEVGARYLLWDLGGLDIYQPDTSVSTVREVNRDTHCDWKIHKRAITSRPFFEVFGSAVRKRREKRWNVRRNYCQFISVAVAENQAETGTKSLIQVEYSQWCYLWFTTWECRLSQCIFSFRCCQAFLSLPSALMHSSKKKFAGIWIFCMKMMSLGDTHKKKKIRSRVCSPNHIRYRLFSSWQPKYQTVGV